MYSALEAEMNQKQTPSLCSLHHCPGEGTGAPGWDTNGRLDSAKHRETSSLVSLNTLVLHLSVLTCVLTWSHWTLGFLHRSIKAEENAESGQHNNRNPRCVAQFLFINWMLDFCSMALSMSCYSCSEIHHFSYTTLGGEKNRTLSLLVQEIQWILWE